MKTNLPKPLLALVGVCAAAAYVLACRPEFSPDGKKIVFQAFDSELKRLVVTVYHRDSGRLEPLFMAPGDGPVASRWMEDGSEVVALYSVDGSDKGPYQIACLPVGRKGPVRLINVPPLGEAAGVFFTPPPLIGNRLFLWGTNVTRVDLKTGEAKTTPEGVAEGYLYGEAGRVFYLRGLPNKEGIEVGTVQTEDLSLQPRFQLSDQNDDFDDLNMFLAISQGGARVALSRERRQPKGAHQILVYRGRELERTLAIGTEAQPLKLGNLLWSHDEKTLYAAGFRRPSSSSSRKDASEFILCEIPLLNSPERFTPVCLIAGTNDISLSVQIALAPDGKFIAATTAHTGQRGANDLTIAPEQRALYLVDLTSAQRKVTRVPTPGPVKPKGAAAK